MKIFQLNKKQQKLFDKLKKTYEDCEKAGIVFYNHYSRLTGLNGKYIEKVDDVETDETIRVGSEDELTPEFSIDHEWSDDVHYYYLTEVGKKEYKKEKAEDMELDK